MTCTHLATPKVSRPETFPGEKSGFLSRVAQISTFTTKRNAVEQAFRRSGQGNQAQTCLDLQLYSRHRSIFILARPFPQRKPKVEERRPMT